ncbi:surface-adhesin E family protein [Ralstonia sp. SET104]|uniref:surface-adhesin E family protein n=1 Tax=Ralstonia sp. SET104 TaxID=2448774 RepID=UPI000F58E329|nr:surface-adhesin E family protein [Ralstonia sp. SET104]
MAGQTVVKRMMWRWIWMCGVGMGAFGMAVPAQAARWHEYLTTTSVVASIDRTSLRSNHTGHKIFLARTVLKRSERRAHGARYRPGTVILSRQEIDCRRQRIRLVDYVVRGPDGATLDTDTAAGAHWMRIRSGTLAARSAAYVCGRR